MKKLIGVAVAAGATVMGAGAANAEVSGSVAFVSDYVFRGISQSDGGPAVQGSLDWTNDMFYAGVWGSSIDLGVGESMEFDLYVGVTPTTGPVNGISRWSAISIRAPTMTARKFDYFEGIVGASIDAHRAMSASAAKSRTRRNISATAAKASITKSTAATPSTTRSRSRLRTACKTSTSRRTATAPGTWARRTPSTASRSA